jgi:hypothetical protein
MIATKKELDAINKLNPEFKYDKVNVNLGNPNTSTPDNREFKIKTIDLPPVTRPPIRFAPTTFEPDTPKLRKISERFISKLPSFDESIVKRFKLPSVSSVIQPIKQPVADFLRRQLGQQRFEEKSRGAVQKIVGGVEEIKRVAPEVTKKVLSKNIESVIRKVSKYSHMNILDLVKDKPKKNREEILIDFTRNVLNKGKDEEITLGDVFQMPGAILDLSKKGLEVTLEKSGIPLTKTIPSKELGVAPPMGTIEDYGVKDLVEVPEIKEEIKPYEEEVIPFKSEVDFRSKPSPFFEDKTKRIEIPEREVKTIAGYLPTALGVSPYLTPLAVPLIASEAVVIADKYTSPEKFINDSLNEAYKNREDKRMTKKEFRESIDLKQLESDIKENAKKEAIYLGLSVGALAVLSKSAKVLKGFKKIKVSEVSKPLNKDTNLVEVFAEVRKGGEKIPLGGYKTTREIKPEITEKITTPFREKFGFKPISEKVIPAKKEIVETLSPLAEGIGVVGDIPTIVMKRKILKSGLPSTQGKISVISGENIPFNIKNFDKLPPRQKYVLKSLVEKMIGRPTTMENVPKLLSKDYIISQSITGERLLGKLKVSRKGEAVFERTPLGRRETIAESFGLELPSKVKGISTTLIGSKRIKTPFARASGDVQFLKGVRTKIPLTEKAETLAKEQLRPLLEFEKIFRKPKVSLTGEAVKKLKPADIKKTPLEKTFKEEDFEPFVKIFKKPIDTAPKKPSPFLKQLPETKLKTEPKIKYPVFEPVKPTPAKVVKEIPSKVKEIDKVVEKIPKGVVAFPEVEDFKRGEVSIITEDFAQPSFTDTKQKPPFEFAPTTFVQRPDVDVREDVGIKPVLGIIETPKFKEKPDVFLKPIPKSFEDVIPKERPDVRLKPFPPTFGFPRPIPKPKPIPPKPKPKPPKEKAKPKPVPITPIPPIGFPSPKRKIVPKKIKIEKEKGYGIEIRRKGKWERINLPFSFKTMSGAEAKAQDLVLKEAAVSYRIVSSDKPAVKSRISVSPLKKVLFRKGKEKGVFIQKKLLRILTPGEKKEISLVGAKARKEKKVSKKTKKKVNNKQSNKKTKKKVVKNTFFEKENESNKFFS